LKISAKTIVVDTGPLIALARLNLLPCLPALFSRVWITEIVRAECSARPEKGECVAISVAIDKGILEVCPLFPENTAWNIDMGESSVIAAALELDAGVLIDDRAGRKFALRMGLSVIGVMGVLVLAKRSGQVPAIYPLTSALVDSGYYLSQNLVEDALRLAGEFS